MQGRLLAAVTPLDAVPDSGKDWHPGSDGFVLNLVHPSLYPIVYGRTMGKVSGSDTAIVLEPPELKGVYHKFVSRHFQFLPSDFSVDGDGRVTLVSPYINNIHPTRHKELYSVIPEILQHALPMFERVLSDLLRPLVPTRVVVSGGYGFRGEATADCIRKYDGNLEVMNNRISLKDRVLQVIVRMANIVLTPERSEYPGGKWHIEGLLQSCSSPKDWDLIRQTPRDAERDDRLQFHIRKFRVSHCTQCPNNVPVLRFGEYQRMQTIVQEGYL